LNFKTVITSVFKGLAIMLVLAVLMPSVVKLSHAFNHHKHNVCDNDNKHETHFHTSDLDCDFYKFKLTKIQFFKLYQYEVKVQSEYFKPNSKYYSSLHSHQQLIRFLRGPPLLM
jgi:hypothetical protein